MRGRLFASAAVLGLTLLSDAPASLVSAEPNEGDPCQRGISVERPLSVRPQLAKTDQLQMTLRGTWTDGADDFAFVFRAEISVNNSLSGAFDWTLTNTPKDSEYFSRIGATGKEFVEGTYSPASRIATFSGSRVSDDTLLGTDSYCVLLSPDLTTFTGNSLSNYGDWRGRLEGTAEVAQ